MSVPELDADARRAALEKAMRARQVRAQLKHMLKAGEVELHEVLDRAQDAPALAKMRVVDVLEAMPGVGEVTAAQIMDDIGIASSRRVQGLGHRQRASLLDRFGDGT